MSKPSRGTTVGLALFRIFVGGLLISMPWAFGNGLDAYGATNVGCGMAVVAAATQMHRAPWLRWVQAALAVAVLFAPFAFGEAVGDKQIYTASMIGLMLIVSSIVTPEVFTQGRSERTSANDAARSSGSNSSSVTTPPK